MKTKKNLFLRIGAVILALLMCAFLFSIANAFVGNPVSAAIAEKAIRNHIDQNYSSLQLELGKVNYSFKFGEYIGYANSKNSVDTNFTVYYQRNGQIYDDYTFRVIEKSNTQRRMEDNYSALVKSILSSLDGLQYNTSIVRLAEKEYDSSKLELDMQFDRALFPDAEITIRLDLEDSSIENITRIMEQSHQQLRQNGCYFKVYSLFSQNKDILVMIDDVTPEMIESGNLAAQLQDALGNENSTEPSVSIRNLK